MGRGGPVFATPIGFGLGIEGSSRKIYGMFEAVTINRLRQLDHMAMAGGFDVRHLEGQWAGESRTGEYRGAGLSLRLARAHRCLPEPDFRRGVGGELSDRRRIRHAWSTSVPRRQPAVRNGCAVNWPGVYQGQMDRGVQAELSLGPCRAGALAAVGDRASGSLLRMPRD